MSKTSATIIQEIESYLLNCTGELYCDYYIGITNDFEGRLFKEHNVDKENDSWIYKKAVDIDNAVAAEKHFLKKGMEGGDKRYDDESVYVYCYLISDFTVE